MAVLSSLPTASRCSFLAGREGGQQIWLADFDPATGAASNARKLTAIWTEADNAKWSPDGKSIVFTSDVYPDCPAITTADFDTGNKCNTDRDAALAASKVKAQIFTHLLYRHWDHFTGDKRSHLFLVSVETGAMRDLNPGDTHDVPPFSLEGPGCGCDFSPDSKELAFTENTDPVPAISTSAADFHARFDRSRGEAGEGEYVGGREFSTRLFARWKVSGVAQSRRGRGMRATSSGWCCMTGSWPEERVASQRVSGAELTAKVRSLGRRVCMGNGFEVDLSDRRRTKARSAVDQSLILTEIDAYSSSDGEFSDLHPLPDAQTL